MSPAAALVCLSLLVLDGQAARPSGASQPGMVATLNKHIATMKVQPEITRESSRTTLNTFKFTNCGNRTDMGEISSIVISPDPLKKNTLISFSFDGFVKNETVGKPVALNVTMKALLDDQWRVLPCYGYIGSCRFDDICEILSQVDCPLILIKHGIQCHCPYKGRYYLPTTDYFLEDGLYPASYQLKLVLAHKGRRVACAEVSFEFA